MPTEQEIRKKLERIAVQTSKLHAQLEEVHSRKLIRCNHCHKRTLISKLTYIQTHWYREPYSCTGGDYWVAGEGQFRCPKCGVINRLYNRPEVVKLKRYFAKIEDTHD